MSERIWTTEQNNVIELRNQNLLVSAAAGSGKTAVLVERIITKILDDDKPVGIDEMLVVTFTKAAAAEMKERIRVALEKRLEAEPDNKRISEQITLVANASIMTIDGFCLNLIREHFVEIGIDPSFRVADSGEIELIKAQALANVLEDNYANSTDEFKYFVNCLSPGRDDSRIEEVIMKLYKKADSYPWPKEWLEKCLQSYASADDDEFEKLEIVKCCVEYVKDAFADSRLKMSYALKLCFEEGGPNSYADTIASECEAIDAVLASDGFVELRQNLLNISFGRLNSAKNVDEGLKNTVQAIRNKHKELCTKNKIILEIKSDLDKLKASIADNSIIIGEAVRLTTQLLDECKRIKTEKNVIEFSDMEHLAIDLLIKRDNDSLSYTEVADRLSEQYDEIMIDEYQDSNFLQEYIMNAMSGIRFGRNNMFMVGDVKQSIYSFRQAKPELFVDKYNSYSKELESGAKGVRIELQKNFRSREEVLAATNDVFFASMRECVGKIEYTDDVKLNAGASFEQPADGNISVGGKCEVIIANTDGDVDKAEAEAAIVAQRIMKLREPGSEQYIFDAEKKQYRPVEFGDIVILLRKDGGLFQTYSDVLMNCGIPVSVQSDDGLLDSYEVRIIMEALRVVDNPFQNISLASLLVSYYGRMSYEELGIVRSKDTKKYLYDNLSEYILLDSGDEKIKKKIADVLERIERWRKNARENSLYELLWDMIHTSGYNDYCSRMPAGEKRVNNLNVLLNRAKKYESTGIKGLFNFLRYIDNNKKYNIEFGEASSTSGVNAVRIMTIHKSKGLEFPVVFLGALSKMYNFQDQKDSIVVDDTFGLGSFSFDLKRRQKRTTLFRELINRRQRASIIAEEIRILYVAMTRAKEKLILAGTLGDVDSSMEKYEECISRMEMSQDKYSFGDIEGNTCYMDLIMPVALKKNQHFMVEIFDKKDYISVLETCEKVIDFKDTNVLESIREYGRYPYQEYIDIKGKFSVSEIKKMSYKEDENSYEGVGELIKLTDYEGISGAEKGTAYHKVMELLDYSKELTLSEITNAIEDYVDKEYLTRLEADCINANDIYAFTQSDIGKRVRKAFSENRLFREQPFVMGIASNEIELYQDKNDCNQMVLVQGVIDLFMIEEDRIVLVDYKTDSVHKQSGRDELIGKYKKQLELYARAISSYATDNMPIEKWIYSFTLAEGIEI